MRKHLMLILGEHDDPDWGSIKLLRKAFKDYWLRYKELFDIEYYEDLNHLPFKRLVWKCLSAKALVFLRATPGIAHLIKTVRELDSKQEKIVIMFTEESPSIGLSNFRIMGLNQSLNSNDILIANNERDQRLIKNLCNLRSVYIPASSSSFFSRKSIKNTDCLLNLAYIGRISQQKNIHTLLMAVYAIRDFLRKAKSRLFIFGAEDDYGSPNMGINGYGYKESLLRLIKSLGIGDLVNFKGFYQNPKNMYKEIKSLKCLNVSLSLHSDEDFGYSILEAISEGVPSIVSDWEGYSQFAQDFPEFVSSISVYKTLAGPAIDPFEVAREIKNQMITLKMRNCAIPEKYLAPPLISVQPSLAPKPFRFSMLAKKIHSQVTIAQHKNNSVIKAYRGYTDPLLHRVVKTLGANKEIQTDKKRTSFLLPPWSEKVGKSLIVTDPHRGQFKFEIKPGVNQCRIAGKRREHFHIDNHTKQALLCYGMIY